MDKINDSKQSLLLHCCCAPCASHVLGCLTPLYDCTVLFYNPNIEPREEYEKRKGEIEKLLVRNSLCNDVEILDCSYDNDTFAQLVSKLRSEPEGGARCSVCYKLRLRETAKRAAEKFELFTTTLSVSPYKNAKLLNEIGDRLAKEYGTGYLCSDFKKEDGYKHSVELSKEYDLYRQNFCGCMSSNRASENKIF